MKKTPWALDPTEVAHGYSSSTHNGRGTGTTSRTSRTANTSTIEVHLTHLPTKIKVCSRLGPGNFSRTKIKEFKEEAFTSLFFTLEAEVAKKLRIPGFLART